MHIVETNSDNLSCQVNIRMTPGMREQLATRAREQWTSASQVARMAVARELDRQLAPPKDELLEQEDES